jgi:uncharacterized protein YidB (DUF937 family)
MQKAAEARIAQALDDGRITEEQADLMLAGLKLRAYIDHQEILASALGITPEELEAARENGSLRDLIEELGLDRETLHENMQAAKEAAIDQAVADGVITEAQAEALKAAHEERGGKRGMKGMRGFPGRGGDGGGARGGFSGGFGSWQGDADVYVPSGTL